MRKIIATMIVVWCIAGASQTTARPEYTVSVARLHASESGHGRFGFRDDGFYATTLDLKSIASVAYNIYESKQWIGWPKWAGEKQWDFEAKVAPEDVEAAKKLTPVEKRAMLQKVLADRFGLVVHQEKRELPVLALVVTSNDFKLKPTTQDASYLAAHPHGAIKPGKPGEMDVVAMTMQDFAPYLNHWASRIVVDRTNLQGRYDFELHFAPDALQIADDNDPALFTALQEQLGFKLLSSKALVDVFVVDNVHEPDPN